MIARLRANPNQVTIKIHYQDLDGKSIPGLSDTAISGNIGDTYKIPRPAIEGYQYVDSSLPFEGKFETNQSAVVTCVNPYGTTIIHYLDESDNKIHDDFTYTGDLSSEEYQTQAQKANLDKITFEGKTYEHNQDRDKNEHNGNDFEVFMHYKLKQ